MPPVLRRWAVLLAAALVLVACAVDGSVGTTSPLEGAAGNPPDGPAANPVEPSADGEPPGEPDDAQADPADVLRSPEAAQPDPGLPPAPDPAPPFELSEVEVLPNAKRYASDLVQALTTYDPESTPEQLAAQAVDGADVAPLAEVIRTIHHPTAWSRGVVVYPQLGGATDEQSSVMVVVDQTIGTPDGRVRTERRTMDVRLRVVDGVWRFEELASAGGVPVARPSDLSPVAAAVLDDDRIELPDSARWDIHAGRIRPELLELMTAMADVTPYGVVVLDTGHPFHIFGTDRQSAHTRGLAVDLHHLGGPLVIDDRADDSRTREFVQWLFDRDDVLRIGAPWALDGFGGRSFTDIVHQDHLHIEPVARD